MLCIDSLRDYHRLIDPWGYISKEIKRNKIRIIHYIKK